MGNSFTFPVSDSAGLADKLARWVGRWSHGGIEQYSAWETRYSAAQSGADDEFAVNQKRIWLDGLPNAFSGLRVVQISDIHHGMFLSKEWLACAVRQANRLRPDVVALTGDFVTY